VEFEYFTGVKLAGYCVYSLCFYQWTSRAFDGCPFCNGVIDVVYGCNRKIFRENSLNLKYSFAIFHLLTLPPTLTPTLTVNQTLT